MMHSPDFTFDRLIERSAKNHPAQPALSFVNQKPISYSSLYKKIRRLSCFLLEHGIRKGDKIALYGENSPNWGIFYFAVTTIGAVIVPILPDFRPNEVKAILEHSESRMIGISGKLLKKMSNVVVDALSTIVRIDDFDIFSDHSSFNVSETDAARLNFDETGEKPITRPNAAEPLNEDDLAAIIYTSGTTGQPKGVMLSHKNIISNAIAGTKIQTVTSNDRFLSVLPLSHTYECTIGMVLAVMQGASVYYLDRPPAPNVLLPAMKTVRPTMMLTVPMVIEKLYKNKISPQLNANRWIRTACRIGFLRRTIYKKACKKLMAAFGGELHFFGIGGAALDPTVEKFLREGKFPYAIGYGLTETSPLIAGTNPQHSAYRSTGPGIVGISIKINTSRSDTGEGEILVKGENVMKGYYKDPERTREVFTEDGWFRTGDLGTFNKHNYLYIKGRLKNLILGPSGENIYPEEIEALINNHEFVLESIVYELKGKLVAKVHLNHEKLEATFNELKENASRLHADMQQRANELTIEIKAYVNERVNKFSRLSEVLHQAEPFEKTPTHKIKRYKYV